MGTRYQAAREIGHKEKRRMEKYMIELTTDEMMDISGGGFSFGFEFTDFKPDHIYALTNLFDIQPRRFKLLSKLIDIDLPFIPFF